MIYGLAISADRLPDCQNETTMAHTVQSVFVHSAPRRRASYCSLMSATVFSACIPSTLPLNLRNTYEECEILKYVDV